MKKKVLLMGKSGAGKTSMRSIIFANYVARDTRRLGATIDVEHSHVRFLGNLVLNLWDCGGQEVFMENYIVSQRDQIFRNVEVLIYVFDVESRELERDMHYYQSCIEAIQQLSKDARVFCLIHKMDLVPEDQRNMIFYERDQDLKRRSHPLNVTCFQTSIWDETLYRAWSAIVHSLVPNVHILEAQLANFCNQSDATEAILFERTTFLVISSHTQEQDVGEIQPGHTHNAAITNNSIVNSNNSNNNSSNVVHSEMGQVNGAADVHRFEKVSNIIKQFKLSCARSQAQFQSMELRTPAFSAFIQALTANMFVMVVVTDPTIQPAVTHMNIAAARKDFERIEQRTTR